jgi:hypothetical protein
LESKELVKELGPGFFNRGQVLLFAFAHANAIYKELGPGSIFILKMEPGPNSLLYY